MVQTDRHAAYGRDGANTVTSSVEKWVDEAAGLTEPARVVWCNGSKVEYDQLIEAMLHDGTLLPLDQRTYPGCYLHRSHPSDVARTEQAPKPSRTRLETAARVRCISSRCSSTTRPDCLRDRLLYSVTLEAQRRVGDQGARSRHLRGSVLPAPGPNQLQHVRRSARVPPADPGLRRRYHRAREERVGGGPTSGCGANGGSCTTLVKPSA
jgi:hypothetical protein